MAFSQDFIIVDKAQHDLKNFNCGKPDMDTYLARFAFKNMQLGLSRTWVLPTIKENPAVPNTRVAAYYTLASSAVNRESLPTDKSLPRYPVSVVLLARLAVDKEFSGQRLGEKTLITALRKVIELTDTGLPALGVILDVLDEDALRFYQHYDMFEAFTDDPMRLFVSMNTLKQVPTA